MGWQLEGDSASRWRGGIGNRREEVEIDSGGAVSLGDVKKGVKGGGVGEEGGGGGGGEGWEETVEVDGDAIGELTVVVRREGGGGGGCDGEREDVEVIAAAAEGGEDDATGSRGCFQRGQRGGGEKEEEEKEEKEKVMVAPRHRYRTPLSLHSADLHKG